MSYSKKTDYVCKVIGRRFLDEGSIPSISTIKNLRKKVFVNNRIKADKVRLIDEEGKQLGVFSLEEALKKAREKDLDLVKVTGKKVSPPVCKIMEYGKYLYELEKREKKQEQKGGELKGVRLGYNISEHDMKIKMKRAEKFLNKGNKVKIEMRLRGRENAHKNIAEEKVKKFLEILRESIAFKVEKDIKRKGRSFTVIISK